MKKLFIILPAFNEEKVIAKVLDDLKKQLKHLEQLKQFKQLEPVMIVVDDASFDKTGKIAKDKGAIVLRHIINRGLGGALATGLEYARINQADIAVTMDSDGQHDPQDLHKIIKPILEKKAEVVIGSRFLEKSNSIPWDRKPILWVSNIITFLFFRIYTTDSQSGFRAFSKKAIEKIRLKTQRMEVSSELFDQIKKNNLKLIEVPVKVVYTSYSRAKGQSNLNTIKVMIKLILRLAR